MKNSSNLQIPEPCFENWAGMTPDKNGRFCGSCCTVVVDFTAMTPEEIRNYLSSRTEQKTCGRFNISQLASKKKSVREKWTGWLHSAQTIKVRAVRFVAVTFAGALLLLSGCHRKAPVVGYVKQDENNQPPKQEQTQQQQQEQEEHYIKMGKIAAPPQPKPKKK